MVTLSDDTRQVQASAVAVRRLSVIATRRPATACSTAA